MRAPAAAQGFREILAADPGCGHVSRWLRAGVEVLVEPAVRWHQQRAFRPIDADVLARLGVLRDIVPQQSEAGAAQNADLRTGSVTVGALVGARSELGNGRLHGVIAEDHLDAAIAVPA